jgi:Glycosyl hydrolase family 81 C-terminal domain
MSPNNTTQPSQMLGNFVTGVTWMNKMDHTTFFGVANSPTNNEEMTEGIHMIPLTPISPFIRLASFVQDEWNTRLASIMPQVNSGWKGICYANLAISDPQTAWNFFTTNFNSSAWLDDGASLTWYLAFVAGLLNGGATTSGGTTSAGTSSGGGTTTSPMPPPPAPPPPAPPAPPPPAVQPWSPTAFYNVGALVTYNGNTYQCLIAHQAQISWTPAVAPSLWKLVSS